MSDCRICRNYKICKIEKKDKVDKCFFVYPTEEELAKDTKEYAIGYKQGISDERERIIAELEKAESYYRNLYREHSSSLDEKRAFGIKKAIEILRGEKNENEI